MKITDEQVISVFVLLANGDLDSYEVLTRPSTEAQKIVAVDMQRRFDRACEGRPLHPDDDFEELLDIVCDEYAVEFHDLL